MVPESLRTPLKLDPLLHFLAGHPDISFVSKIVEILSVGANIGFVGPDRARVTPNAPSARKHADVLLRSVLKEVSYGHAVGPFFNPPFPNFIVSSLGVRPKKNGDYRIILDLSQPFGDSVNTFIDKQCYSMRYSKFDDAVHLVQSAGIGALMGKLDIKSAFRLIPVRKQDWHLLGYAVENLLYFDVVLPFGCRSSPYLFCLFSEALHWIFVQSLGRDPLTHYVDDFFFVGRPLSSECSVLMSDFMTLCAITGVPLADEKCESPVTVCTFLGIQLDSVRQTLSLPPGKLKEIHFLVSEWSCKTICSRTELQSIIGSLQFAAKCIPAGRLFTRRLINALSYDHHQKFIALDQEMLLDLIWWRDFLPVWNGTASFLSVNWLSPLVTQLFTDAAASVGFAAYCSGRWFNLRWSEAAIAPLDVCIELLEMIPIYVACAIWASEFSGKRILFHSDNLGCVQAWAKLGSTNSAVLSLMREIVAVAALNNFALNIVHISGISNSIADALSRFQMDKFRDIVPNAAAKSIVIPPDILKVIGHHLSFPVRRNSFSTLTLQAAREKLIRPE